MKKYIKPETAVYETKLVSTILNVSNPSFEVDTDPGNGVDAEESLVREELTWETVW